MKSWFGAFLFVCALFASLTGSQVRASEPGRTIGQYKQTRWTVDDGAPTGIGGLAQGASGYLWIGASSGLFRFDGLKFEHILPVGRTESSAVSALMVSREGDVWVGYKSGDKNGTSVFHDGVLRDVPMPSPAHVMDFAQTPDGSIWATLGRKVHQLMRYRDGHWSNVASSLGFPDEHLCRMTVAHDGTLWVTSEKSVLFLRYGSQQFERTAEKLDSCAAVAEDARGSIWLTDQNGSRALIQSNGSNKSSSAISYPVPNYRRAPKTVFDRDGNLWGEADNGIFRLESPVLEGSPSARAAELDVSRFQKADGLTSDATSALLADREGNMWVGTEAGLDRFRATKVVTEPKLTRRAFWGDVLLGASDGTVYIGEADAVYRVRPGANPEVILHATEPQAMCEGEDRAIWIVLQDDVVQLKDGNVARFAGPGKVDAGISDCAIDRQGQIWLAAMRDGLFEREGDRWRQMMVPSPEGDFPPTTLLRNHKNELLIGFTGESLGLLDPPHLMQFVLGPRSGLGEIRTFIEGPDGLVIGGRLGLGLIKGGRVRTLTIPQYPQFRNVAGVVQTDAGQTWLSSHAGIVGVSTAALMTAFDDPTVPLNPTVLDAWDGLRGPATQDTTHPVVKGGDGRLWFADSLGTVWIDPAYFTRNDMIPPVSVGSLKAEGVTHLDPDHVLLPAGTSNIEIGYAAPSLSIPQRVHILYKLAGADPDWVDPGLRRQAFYTNLGAGHYAFQVIAANDDGVWNHRGAELEFDIPPTFLQSNYFVALCALSICGMLWCLYLVRVQQLTVKMRSKLEERLAERERIARDLHDTLLQGFQGLILRFQSVANEIPPGQRARSLIDKTLDSADVVLAECRDSVQQLRSTGVTDLAQALSETAERLRHDHTAEFKLVVEGTPRALRPVVLAEVCRIGDEALINAFRHAKATTIEVAISYQASAIAVGVRDDGVGIDAETFRRGGRQGHFGLVGMRERAQQISADLHVESRPGGGTEIQVIVPGRVAYARDHRSPQKRLRERLLARWS